jgi:hypothetical protein
MTDNPAQIAHVQRLDTIQKRLAVLHHTVMLPWRVIAERPEYLGIPPGMLCAISKGREPKNNRIRIILGLPVLAPAPVCPTCGKVHISKICPTTRKKVTRVKHICENCTWWRHGHPLYETNTQKPCVNDQVHSRVGLLLITRLDFGCRFWKRKEAQL